MTLSLASMLLYTVPSLQVVCEVERKMLDNKLIAASWFFFSLQTCQGSFCTHIGQDSSNTCEDFEEI